MTDAGHRTIPVLDVHPEIEALWDELMSAIQEVLRGGRFIMGPNVLAFEQEMAKYLGVKHAIAVNSGTDALVIGLRALGIGQGAEVITTPFTFFATSEAVHNVGATPVFVDIDPDSYNIDATKIEAAITERTRAIIPVHLYGRPCEMDAIMRIANKYNLVVLEDVAQALGAEYKGQKVGTFGDAGALSFFPSKNLGGFGDGGMIVTNRDDVAEMARMLRVHGSRKKYYNELVGYNSRLDEIQAAILRVKLPRLDAFNDGRRQVARWYDELLQDVDGVRVSVPSEHVRHVYHQYTIRIVNHDRDTVQARLRDQGISTMVYYPVPLHKLAVYKDQTYSLPNAERAAAEVLSLPIWPQMTRETVKTVVTALRNVLSEQLKEG